MNTIFENEYEYNSSNAWIENRDRTEYTRHIIEDDYDYNYDYDYYNYNYDYYNCEYTICKIDLSAIHIATTSHVQLECSN
jgi:hypothetical protein